MSSVYQSINPAESMHLAFKAAGILLPRHRSQIEVDGFEQERRSQFDRLIAEMGGASNALKMENCRYFTDRDPVKRK